MRIIASLLLFIAFHLQAQPDNSYLQKIPGSSVQFMMKSIPGGTFKMGSKSILADSDEGPVKEVELSPFWMGEHEVTAAEWDEFFKDQSIPQSKGMDGITRATPQYIDLTWGMGRQANHPVNSMSQQACTMYCQWLYAKTGIFYRLPTEAEWEYACKAGEQKTDTPLPDVAWFAENSASKYQLVATKKANAWGLYDMLGNLSEWTIDQYDPVYYQTLAAKDPVTTPGARYPRSVRGGSYMDQANQLRCSNRIASDPKWNQRDPQIPKSRWWMTDGMFMGFRIVRPAKQPSADEIKLFYSRYTK